ncbi:nucleoside-diphosphate-sugar epimerase [Candidatus Magnetobacterium bavaricum]|uniref:Nucleoside-diphosphate-sugar epimerase n=1 Tax=Candidatus Magnetobacterium bavaricum TaxID=29290 RepID=A0A0F3GW61_9BACT|nr:nucleoside-diphosphate-sugar epimerase [Candidatus Magnetobacterium bavaricum]
MNVALITGSAGLIGGEAVEFLADKFDIILGIDNNLREMFFGPEASTSWNRQRLKEKVVNYRHYDIDIRDEVAMREMFSAYGTDIRLIVHTAAQPSHDWAAREPATDFSVNATATLNLLELTRRYCPDAVFIFTSTNKVYGDAPNSLPLVEHDTRWEIDVNHPYHKHGIDESMSIDQCKHSLFGVSKVSADLMVQEYGRYFGIKTVCFRGGCLTGPNHSGAQLHGFLSYLMRCAIVKEPYTIFGYKGKQVRDNIHCHDLVNMFWHFYQRPRIAAVYNAGGSRHSNCSILEAIAICERLTGNKMRYSYVEGNRIGDHIWWISDVSKFKTHYPQWDFKHDLVGILSEILTTMKKRL